MRLSASALLGLLALVATSAVVVDNKGPIECPGKDCPDPIIIPRPIDR